MKLLFSRFGIDRRLGSAILPIALLGAFLALAASVQHPTTRPNSTSISLSAPACPAKATYTGSFIGGQEAPAQAQQDWSDFRQTLVPADYDTVTISGTFDNVGRTLTDSVVVPQIAAALKNSFFFASGTWNAGGRTWNVGPCGDGRELNVSDIGANNCGCNGPEVYTIRPQIGVSNSNWGGVNTATCGGPSQTITVIFSGPGAPSCAKAPSGMSGWWPGEGNLNDIQGGHNGTPVNGGPTFEAGEVNQAMSFNGTSQTVTVDNSPDPNAPYSFDMWGYWKGTTNGSGHDALLVKTQNANGSGGDSYGMFIANADNSFLTIMGGDAFVFSTAPGSVPLNQWFHVAQTFDGVTAKVYMQRRSGCMAKRIAQSQQRCPRFCNSPGHSTFLSWFAR